MLISVLAWPSYPVCLEKLIPTPILQSQHKRYFFLILYLQLVVPDSTSNIFIVENHCTVVVKGPQSQIRVLE